VTGDTLLIFTPQDAGVVLGGATPATPDSRSSHFMTLDFDGAAGEWAVFSGILPAHYNGGTFSVILTWSATSATSGNVRWQVQLGRVVPGTTDLGAPGYVSTLVTAAAPGSAGRVTTTTFALSAPTGVAAGQLIQVLVNRMGADSLDTMSGDAELLAAELREA
jgi:hypothetical protein